jgi:hypothetical protein
MNPETFSICMIMFLMGYFMTVLDLIALFIIFFSQFSV